MQESESATNPGYALTHFADQYAMRKPNSEKPDFQRDDLDLHAQEKPLVARNIQRVCPHV
jgi:hypothetical protein